MVPSLVGFIVLDAGVGLLLGLATAASLVIIAARARPDGPFEVAAAGPGVPGGVLDITTLSPSHAWTAGGMISTVSDLARFHRALFTGHLLRPAQLRELKSVVPGFDYGMGVTRWDTSCGTAWGHGGSFPGYYSVSLTSPDGSRQAVIALNSNQFLSDQTQTDLDLTLETAFCGQASVPGHLPMTRSTVS
jgi:D-alanyl-D-alanine carboxypeptidase